MSRIPKQAKLVFKGVIFNVYQWPQKLFDGSIETFEMLERADTAIVVGVTSNGQLLTVIDRQPGRKPAVTFPGGRVEPGEDALAAAKRELLEETGYSAEEWELWYRYAPDSKVASAVHYFVARGIVKTASPQPDPGEKIVERIVPIDQVFDEIVDGVHHAFALGSFIMQKMLQGKRQELIDFLLSNHKN